jgi:Ca-activated chloride channel family protein
VSFQEPWRLALVVAPIALFVAYLIVQRGRRKYALRFTSVDLLASVAPRRPGWQRHVSAALMLAAVLALVTGLARPATTKRVPKDHGTILLAIDTSGSMAATDVAPSRLAAAQDAARRFVDALPPGLKIGLLSFDSTARVLAAPTSDHAPILSAIRSLSIGGGTATGDAINQSLSAIAAIPTTEDGKKVPGAVVLMSDGSPTIGRTGQTPEASVSEATAKAKQDGVPVDTIAFGTPDGTVESQGETIPVPADPQTMAKIASESGGKSFTAANSKELNSVYEQIRRSVGYDNVKVDITMWFVAMALLAALLAATAGLFWMQRIP